MADISAVSGKKYITRMGISFSVNIIMKNMTKSITIKKRAEKRREAGFGCFCAMCAGVFFLFSVICFSFSAAAHLDGK